jgi:hypothetical protein
MLMHLIAYVRDRLLLYAYMCARCILPHLDNCVRSLNTPLILTSRTLRRPCRRIIITHTGA